MMSRTLAFPLFGRRARHAFVKEPLARKHQCGCEFKTLQRLFRGLYPMLQLVGNADRRALTGQRMRDESINGLAGNRSFLVDPVILVTVRPSPSRFCCVGLSILTRVNGVEAGEDRWKQNVT